MFGLARFAVRNKLIVAVGGIAAVALIGGAGQDNGKKPANPWSSAPAVGTAGSN